MAVILSYRNYNITEIMLIKDPGLPVPKQHGQISASRLDYPIKSGNVKTKLLDF